VKRRGRGGGAREKDERRAKRDEKREKERASQKRGEIQMRKIEKGRHCAKQDGRTRMMVTGRPMSRATRDSSSLDEGRRAGEIFNEEVAHDQRSQRAVTRVPTSSCRLPP
jgi:hypothetical protein